MQNDRAVADLRSADIVRRGRVHGVTENGTAPVAH